MLSFMSRPNLNKEQEEDLQKLNQMNQQLRIMQNQQIQMETQKLELERTIDSLNGLGDDHEIYRQTGQVLFRAKVADTREDLKGKLELIEVRVTQGSNKITEYQKSMQELDTKIRGYLNI